MEKCFDQIVSTHFNGEKIYIDLTNKKKPILSKPETLYNYYYSYYYDEDENLPYFELYVTDICNLKCPYCFNKYSEESKVVSPYYQLGELVSFIKKKSPEGKLGIKFIGGEPLLNKKWIYRVVEELKKTHLTVYYNINTNMSLIDDTFIDFANKHNFFVMASVDGGDDPYKGDIYKDTIFCNIVRLLNAGVTVSGRMVYWPNEQKSLKQLVEQSLDTGLKVLSLTLPWGRQGSEDQLVLFEKNLQEFADFYVDRVLHRDFRYIGVTPFTLYIRHFIFDRKCWKDNCAAGKDIYSIDMHGNIFPCHCFSGIYSFYSGSIYNSEDVIRKFQDYNVDSIEECRICQIRYICKAKCYGDNYFTNQNILKANKFRCRCEERIVACSAYILKKIMENSEIYPVFQYAIGKGEKKFDNTK